MTPGVPLLDARDLRKTFDGGRVHALRGMDLAIAADGKYTVAGTYTSTVSCTNGTVSTSSITLNYSVTRANGSMSPGQATLTKS